MEESMSAKTYRVAWMMSLLIAATIACGLLPNIGDQIGEVIGTAESIATEILESDLVKTSQAMITEVSGSGMIETIQAEITEGIPDLDQSIVTKIASGFDEAPPDIPLVGGEEEGFIGTKDMVSYLTVTDFDSVVDFYKNEMPANGWTLSDDGTIEMDFLVQLNYEKPDRKASVSITKNPIDNKTVVAIFIQTK